MFLPGAATPSVGQSRGNTSSMKALSLTLVIETCSEARPAVEPSSSRGHEHSVDVGG